MSSVESKLFASTDISGDATHKRKRVRKRKTAGSDDAPESSAPAASPVVATTDVNKPTAPAAPRKAITVVDARDPAPEPTSVSAPADAAPAPAGSASPKRSQQAKRSRPVVYAPGASASAASASEMVQLPSATTDVAALRAQVEALTKLVTSLAKPGHRSARLANPNAPVASPASMETLLGAAGSPLLLPPVPETRARTVCIHGLPFNADYFSVARWLLMELVRARIIPASNAPPREAKSAAAKETKTEGDSTEASKPPMSEALRAATAAAAAPGAGEAEREALRVLRRAEKQERKAFKAAQSEGPEAKLGRVAQYQATLAKFRGVKADLERAGIAQLRLVENKTHSFKGFAFVTFESDELAAATVASHVRSAEAVTKKLADSARAKGGDKGAEKDKAAAAADTSAAPAAAEGEAAGSSARAPHAGVVARIASGHPLSAMQGRIVGMEPMRSTLVVPVPITHKNNKGGKKGKKDGKKEGKKTAEAAAPVAAETETAAAASDSD